MITIQNKHEIKAKISSAFHRVDSSISLKKLRRVKLGIIEIKSICLFNSLIPMNEGIDINKIKKRNNNSLIIVFCLLLTLNKTNVIIEITAVSL